MIESEQEHQHQIFQVKLHTGRISNIHSDAVA